MNLNRLIRLLLLQLFVLLQCMAPLAHAHVSGDHTDLRVHIAAIDAPGINVHGHHSHAGAEHLSHADHHSAVVCMPPENRCNALIIDEPAVTTGSGKFALREHAAVTVAGFYPQSFPPAPYRLPDSQAPPL